MKYLVLDTEGNGLFRYKDENGNPVPADDPSQPRLAQLAMIFLDDNRCVERTYSAYVKPDGWEMQPGATEVNGLTTEILMEKGIPVREVLEAYTAAILEDRAVVAFNAQHDLKQIRGELRRAGMPDLFEQTRNVCVMRKANGHIPKATGKKGWPSLAEARTFMKLPPDGAHDAVADANAAFAIFIYLWSSGADLTPEVHYAKRQEKSE